MSDKTPPKPHDVETYYMVSELLSTSYHEIKELSKKKPNDPLNEFKVNKINKVLNVIKELLANEPTAMFLDLLDNDNIPSNSDVALVLGEYDASLKNFKKKYSTITGWVTSEGVFTFRELQ